MGNGMASASDDAARYRSGYPGQIDPPLAEARQNLDFYTGALRSRPDNALISEFHAPRAEGGWFGAYDELEMRHGYIQWLFPIREPGMNSEAQPLTTFEAEAIRADPDAVARVRRSLALILDFWGVALADDDDDAAAAPLARAPHWAAASAHLDSSFHNYLRITRVIKSVGELGLERFQEAIVAHFAEEVYEKGALQNCERSLRTYWFPVVRDADARARLSARFAALAPAEDADGDAGDESASGDEDDASAEPSMPPLPPADRGIGDVATSGSKRPLDPEPSEL